jgi:hypothetical protein
VRLARIYLNVGGFLPPFSIDHNKLASAFSEGADVGYELRGQRHFPLHNISAHQLSSHEDYRIKHGYPPAPRINALAEIA